MSSHRSLLLPLPSAIARSSLLVGVACCMYLSACSTARPDAQPVQQGDFGHMTRSMDALLLSALKRTSVPGAAVAVVDEQGVVWARTYGVTDTRSLTAVSMDTRFRVGSVSKLLTATEVMRRAGRGEIHLDAPLAAQLPGFRMPGRFEGAQPLTVRALLSHHAGLPANHLRGMWEAQPESLAQLQAALSNEPLIAPPQTRYVYSNPGYALLGRLIEERSGLPFAAALQHELLRPAGMQQASFERRAQLALDCAPGHRKGQPVQASGLRDEPAGALVASASDMAKFLQLVLAQGQANGRQLIAAEALEAMFQPQFEGLPLDFGHRMGLGWMLSGVEVPGAGPIAWHAGQYPGYQAAVLVSRSDKLAAVVLANGEEARSFTLQAAAKALELALEAKTGRAAPPRPEPKPALRTDARPEALAPLAGDYAIFGNKTAIQLKKGRLAVELFDTTLDLVPTTDEGRFVLQKGVLGVLDFTLPDLFVRFTSAGGQRYAVLGGLPAPFAFERLEKRPIPPAWLSRLGRYTSDTADNTLAFREFELAVDDGVLIARIVTHSAVTGIEGGKGRVPMRPVSDGLAEVYSGGALDGGALQATRRDGKDTLLFSGYVLTKMTP
jgi:CubicO group peptidase (beta-lactamase class C family)